MSQQSERKPTAVRAFNPKVKTETESLYSRYRLLDPQAVRVTRLRSGTTLEEVQVWDTRGPGEPSYQWLTPLELEVLLYTARQLAELSSLQSRALKRLDGIVINSMEDFNNLPVESKRILRLSQRQWDRSSGYNPNGVAGQEAGTERSAQRVRNPPRKGDGRNP